MKHLFKFIVLLTFLLSLVACPKADPEFDFNGNFIASFDNSSSVISFQLASPSDSVLINGNCSSLVDNFFWQYDANSWSGIGGDTHITTSELNCTDGNFSFLISPIPSLIQAQLTASNSASIFIKVTRGSAEVVLTVHLSL